MTLKLFKIHHLLSLSHVLMERFCASSALILGEICMILQNEFNMLNGAEVLLFTHTCSDVLCWMKVSLMFFRILCQVKRFKSSSQSLFRSTFDHRNMSGVNWELKA